MKNICIAEITELHQNIQIDLSPDNSIAIHIYNFEEEIPKAMILKILLVISILLQFIAASIALKLTRVTKYAVSWILITTGFMFMAVRRLFEFLPFISSFDPDYYKIIYIWMGVFTSLCFAVGVFLIQKIFKYMKHVEQERRRTEKRFLSAVIKAEEGERTRIAKDIHDGLGPLLSAVKLSVSTLETLTLEPRQLKILENARQSVDEAIHSLRDISDHLSPHVLTNFGLTRALSNFIDKINQAGQVIIHLRSNLKERRLDEDVEIVFYRIATELINNAIQHAQASIITISLSLSASDLVMKYEDDGVGFEVDRLLRMQDRDGMGLTNIQSRVKSLKGQMIIDSKPGLGSRFTVTVNIGE